MSGPKITIIEVKKKYKSILINYLQKHELTHRVIEPGANGKISIEVEKLNTDDAFTLGAQTQAQLLDGEYLI